MFPPKVLHELHVYELIVSTHRTLVNNFVIFFEFYFIKIYDFILLGLTSPLFTDML